MPGPENTDPRGVVELEGGAPEEAVEETPTQEPQYQNPIIMQTEKKKWEKNKSGLTNEGKKTLKRLESINAEESYAKAQAKAKEAQFKSKYVSDVTEAAETEKRIHNRLVKNKYERMEEVKAQMAAVQAKIKEASSIKIRSNANEIRSKQGFWTKLSLALGHTRTHEMIEKAVQQDVESQINYKKGILDAAKEEMTLYKEMYNILGDEEAGVKASVIASRESAINTLDSISKQTDIVGIKEKAVGAKAELRRKQAEDVLALQKMTVFNSKTTEPKSFGFAKRIGPEGGYGDLVAPGKNAVSDAKSVRDVRDTAALAVQTFRTAEEMMPVIDRTDFKNIAKMKSMDRERIHAGVASIFVTWKEVNNFGAALSPTEEKWNMAGLPEGIETAEQFIKHVVSRNNPKEFLKEMLQISREKMQNLADTQLKAQGFEPAGELAKHMDRTKLRKARYDSKYGNK